MVAGSRHEATKLDRSEVYRAIKCGPYLLQIQKRTAKMGLRFFNIVFSLESKNKQRQPRPLRWLFRGLKLFVSETQTPFVFEVIGHGGKYAGLLDRLNVRLIEYGLQPFRKEWDFESLGIPEQTYLMPILKSEERTAFLRFLSENYSR